MPQCPRGTLLLLDSEAQVARLVPAWCHRWDCPECGPRKAAAHIARVFAAKPERHITLTAHTRRFADPADALTTLKTALRKLRYLLANPDRRPVQLNDHRAYTLEYAAFWELTKGGWPHVHMATWGDYIPHALLSAMWFHLAKSPNVHITRLDLQDHHRHNFQRYLASKVYSLGRLDPAARRITYSADYHRTPPEQDPGQAARLVTTYRLHTPLHLIALYLTKALGFAELPSGDDPTPAFTGDLSKLPPDALYLEECIQSWLARQEVVPPDPEVDWLSSLPYLGA